MNTSSASPADSGSSNTAACVLALNRGSSSLRYALYGRGREGALQPIRTAKFDRVPRPDASTAAGGTCRIPEHAESAGKLVQWLEQQVDFGGVAVIGNRVVHGGSQFWQPQPVTAELLDQLTNLCPLSPEHLPASIALMEALQRRHPALQQVACFDTAFHHDLPRVARILPLPREVEAKGVRRYGFHGLSYTYLMEELQRIAGPEAARGRIVLAHLGAGASLTAVREGKSLDTTMGFTPTAGIPMSTRCGDLDPGLLWFFQCTEKMTPDKFHEMINRRSGLLGISQTTADMRDLVAAQASDVRAAEAVELFCYEAKKRIGAFAAVLGGLDTIVFAGGIGENMAEIRGRICAGLEFLGVELESSRNATNAPLISTDNSRVAVRVIHTDEELMIARASCRLMDAADK
jgi:acetate kinase